MSDDKKEEVALTLRGDDDYERSHMTPEEGVLYRDKFVAPWGWHALMGGTTLASVLPMLLAPDAGQVWPAALLTVAIMAITWLMFSVLRVSVSSQRVQVQLGLFGPDISTDKITHAEAVDYDWKQYGGWGIRKGRDGSWAYNMMGDAGRAARIEYVDDKGKERAVLVTSAEPHLLVDAIQRARGVDTANLDEEIEDAVIEDVDEENEDVTLEASSDAADASSEDVVLDLDEGSDASEEAEEIEEAVATSGTSAKK